MDDFDDLILAKRHSGSVFENRHGGPGKIDTGTETCEGAACLIANEKDGNFDGAEALDGEDTSSARIFGILILAEDEKFDVLFLGETGDCVMWNTLGHIANHPVVATEDLCGKSF